MRLCPSTRTSLPTAAQRVAGLLWPHFRGWMAETHDGSDGRATPQNSRSGDSERSEISNSPKTDADCLADCFYRQSTWTRSALLRELRLGRYRTDLAIQSAICRGLIVKLGRTRAATFVSRQNSRAQTK